MYAIAINYEGWCQIRLATNPDPTDEPRGVSGYSFALAGEPDLDRVIRFQNPVCERPGVTQKVGVTVKTIELLDSSGGPGTRLDSHPLVDGAVELLDSDKLPVGATSPKGPKFEARGYIIGNPGDEPIYPYHIRFCGDQCSFDRYMFFEKDQFEEVHRVPPEVTRRYGAYAMTVHSTAVAEATGIWDPVAFRERRLRDLETALGNESDPSKRVALEQRIAELKISPSEDEKRAGRFDRRTLALTGIQIRNFNLNGVPRIDDPNRNLELTLDDRTFELDTTASWPTEFWFGAWDCDALYSYVKGTVLVPLREQNS